MSKDLIAIINGPNLNLLGTREPNIYGSQSFDTYIFELREKFENATIAYHQTNHEGDIIDLLHHYGLNRAVGIVLNAGGYTHTSISIADAVRAITCPVIEVHISDIYQRETYRHFSYLSDCCVKSISGEGLAGYDSAISHLLSNKYKVKGKKE